MKEENNGAYRVEVRHISKRFGGVVALHDVSLRVLPGEILGLIGENGAGKSTLMNILSGIIQPDRGELFLDGEALPSLTPKVAQQHGIQIVHQELSLLPEMTVSENMMLGNEIRNAAGMIDKKACDQKSGRLLSELEIEIPVDAKIAELSAAQKQLVEIAKSMVGRLKVLILDEPTSSLTDREMKCLVRILRQLQEKKVAIIFISHKLPEVKELCDAITVLRDGEAVRTERIGDAGIDDMVRWMVGRNIEDQYGRSGFTGSPKTLLEVKGLSSAVYGEVAIKDIRLTVGAGEIVGMFGLIGSGRTEIIRCIYGLREIQAGEVIVDGKKIDPLSPKQMIVNGVAWVPEDRRHEGVCLEMSVQNNICLPLYRMHNRFGFVNDPRLKKIVHEYMEGLAVKAQDPGTEVQNLSGGNQQKVVLAKWLASKPKVLILDEPTRGIDVGSKSEIHRLIREMRDEGMGVLVISSEIPELLSLADRILVMRDGVIEGEIGRADGNANEESIIRLATLGEIGNEYAV